MEGSGIIGYGEAFSEAESGMGKDFDEDVLTPEEEEALYEEPFENLQGEQEDEESVELPQEDNEAQEALIDKKSESGQQETLNFTANELVKLWQSDISEHERSGIRNYLLQDSQYAHAFNMATNDDYVLSFISKNDSRAHHIITFGTDKQKQELAQQIMSLKKSYGAQVIDLENKTVQKIRENYVVNKFKELRNHYWQKEIATDPQTAEAMVSIQNSIFESLIAHYPSANTPQHQRFFNIALSEACVNLCEKLQISPPELATALAKTFGMHRRNEGFGKEDKVYEIDKAFIQKAQNIREAQTRAQSLARTNGRGLDGCSLEAFINMSDEELVNLSRNNPAKYAQFEKLLMN